MKFSPALEHLPPQALDSEQGVIGCCLLDGTPAAVEAARELLAEEDFYLPHNRRVFRALLRLNDRDEPADLVTVSEELRHLGGIETAGGRVYLMACMESVPAASRVTHYALKVKEASLRRSLIDVGGKIIGRAFEHDGPVSEVLTFAEEQVYALHDPRRERGLTPAGRIASDEYQRISDAHAAGQEFTGVETGLRALDVMTSGFQPSDLIILAGRPGMGKTAVALSLAVSSAKRGASVAFFSVEMSKQALMQRMLSAETLIDAARIRNGQLRDGEWTALQNAVCAIDELPIHIDDSAELTLPAARSRARRLKMERGLGLVIVDYAQLMARDGAERDTLRLELGRLTRGFKGLGRELNVPVILLSQVSRKCEDRNEKRPILSDLAEGGSLEQDADLVIFPFRPDAYAPDTPADIHGLRPMELIIAKHRNGETGTVHVGFNKRFGILREFPPDVPPEQETWR